MNVTFHVLDTIEIEKRLHHVAKLCEAAFHDKKSVFVLTDVQTQAERLNQFLWTYSPTSFLPHSLSSDDSNAPIVIGHHDQLQKADLLINLSEHVPESLEDFTMIDEVVIQEPKILMLTRRHYKYYQSLDCIPTTEKIA